MDPDSSQLKDIGPDGFPLDPASTQLPWHRLVNEFLTALPEPFQARNINPTKFAAVQTIFDAAPSDQLLALEAVMRRRAWHEKEYDRLGSRSALMCEYRDVLGKLSLLLIRRKLPFTLEIAETLVSLLADVEYILAAWKWHSDLPAVLKVCEAVQGQHGSSPGLRQALEKLLAGLAPGDDGWESVEVTRIKKDIKQLLQAGSVLESGTPDSNPTSNPEDESLLKDVDSISQIKRSDGGFDRCDSALSKKLVSRIEETAARGLISVRLRAAVERWLTAISPRPLTAAEEQELGEASTIAMEESDRRPWEEVSAAFAKAAHLNRIRTALTDERKLIARLNKVLSGKAESDLDIDASDAVGTAIAADVAAGRRASTPAWVALLNHARGLTSSNPSQKWLKVAAELAAGIKAENLGNCLSDWLNQAGKPATRPITIGEISDATLLNDCSVELLKGLAWTIVAAKRADLAPALGNLAEACFKKIPNKGPRNVKVANAATAALAALADPAAAAQLSRLRLRVKHQSSRAMVDKGLATASEKTGLSPDDLAEISVPTFGLDSQGLRHTEFGEHVAELRVANAREVELRWLDHGKECNSVPSTIRTKHADALKQLKREAKDASTMLAAQALRLERSFLTNRSWPLKVWRERFLEPPLVGTLTRRLIWQFDDALAIPHDGHLMNATKHPISPGNAATVSLWHPIRSSSQQVLAWREWLEQHEVTQPFKQAHREIYVLTDAERHTNTYSNRFAAHILRQHQLAALCQSRGWDYRLQGQFDSHNVPTLLLPSRNLRAEFWVQAVEHEATPHGIYVHVSSDQVRFGQTLEDVSPVVFSEVMRDVDLFVGVASVANDPAWHDGGPEGRYRAYWREQSFGDLSESAQSRKVVLERLLPRLTEANRFSLRDKFLIVRGNLRTYRIHLGSGNILMEPNDQYLCIVADRSPGKAAKLYLPFEGDNTLTVIISKALLLASDDRIKDATITRQIRS